MDHPNAPKLQVTKGEIIFKDVKFHYKGTNPLFEKKSVVIKPGQRSGIGRIFRQRQNDICELDLAFI